jgi:hypothetical protein
LLARLTKTPRKSRLDWIARVLTGTEETLPAAGARRVGERLERAAAGGERVRRFH